VSRPLARDQHPGPESHEGDVGQDDLGSATSFEWNGSAKEGFSQQVLAAALIATGEVAFGRPIRTGSARGLYCGMGACWECCVLTSSGDIVRACLERVEHCPVMHSAPPA